MNRPETKEKNGCESNFDVRLGHKTEKICSDLLVNFQVSSKTIGECSSDSDDLFENIQSCKNITFSRSTSYFDKEFKWLPSTPLRLNQLEKENIYSTPNSRLLISTDLSAQSSKANRPHKRNITNNLSSPLKTYNSLMTTPNFKEISNMPKTNEKATPRRRYGDSVNFNLQKSTRKSRPTLNSSKLDGSVEDLEKSDSHICPHTPLNSSCRVTEGLDSSSKHAVNGTPFSICSTSALYQDISTPARKMTQPQVSSFKKYSIMKAVIAARKDFNDILKAATIKRSSLKAQHPGRGSTSFFSSPLQNNKSCQSQSDCQEHTEPLCKSVSKLKNKFNSSSEIYETSSCNKSKTRCHQYSLNTPTIDHNLKGGDARKTPLFSKGMVKCATFAKEQSESITGALKHGQKTDKKKSSSKDIEDDDLPCTQPVSSIIFRGIVAYVEVRSGREYRNLGTSAELESLGAKVEKNFTKKVTHCFFHGGKMSTYRKAIEWKIPIVSTLWIEACKAELQLLPVQNYEPHGIEKYQEALPLYKLKSKIRRPVTDSKVTRKLWQQQSERDKATKAADSNRRSPTRSSGETDKIIDALHSVANGIRKASDKFQKILTSPVLQKKSKQDNCSKNDSEKENSEELFVSKKKRNKQLFVCPGEGDSNKDEGNEPSVNSTVDNSTLSNNTNDTINEIRISYDSDDLLAYAKKQAASVRCSAPARLLTNRKCKKLLSSCHKSTETEKDEGRSNPSKQLGAAQDACGLADSNTKSRMTRSKKSGLCRKGANENGLESNRKTKKRKLLLPSEILTTFEQDSSESTPDLSPSCPYLESPHKKQKTAAASGNKTAKPRVPIPISSDWESDDSLTRAARRESSALFVKKEKKNNLQRCIPTIVCTSLHRSDVETVTAIVSQLGKYAVEGTVSERSSHVVTSCPRRTINILKGIARGCWILNVQWVYESLEVGKWLPEERFELIEFSSSVQQARVERQAFGPEFSLELFVGVGPIYVCRTTVPPCNDLTELLRLCGGCVVSSARAARFVVGSSRPFSPIGQQRQPVMVKEKWVLDCITRLTQLSPFDYIANDSEP